MGILKRIGKQAQRQWHNVCAAAIYRIPERERVSAERTPIGLVAYTKPGANLRIVRANANRKWMSDTDYGFANRCLPLRIANQAGWCILNNHRLKVTWNGGKRASDLMINIVGDSVAIEPVAVSHFGYGIVTWILPVIFRTSPGYNLWVRGPANSYKDGIYPLEGIVETDWNVATFTMNWKITRMNVPIEFAKDDPICTVFPFPRYMLEAVDPSLQDLASNPTLQEQAFAWEDSRDNFLFHKNQGQAKPSEWQKDYYVGREPTGTRFPDHQTTISLKDFTWKS